MLMGFYFNKKQLCHNLGLNFSPRPELISTGFRRTGLSHDEHLRAAIPKDFQYSFSVRHCVILLFLAVNALSLCLKPSKSKKDSFIPLR